jgi:hypothetical protein
VVQKFLKRNQLRNKRARKKPHCGAFFISVE